MVVQPINKMPADSRLWVYQSDRPFTEEEKIQIEQVLQSFLSQWAAHGSELRSTYSIEYDQFIVIAVDENHHAASGCSIDASVGVIRSIEKQFGLSLLDRTKVAVLANDQINVYPFNAIKSKIAEGLIKRDTTIFNNTVDHLHAWQANWRQPASESWMGRFF